MAAAGRGSAVGFTVCARPHPLLHSVLGAHCVPEASATMAADSRDAALLGIFDALPLLAAALVAAAAKSSTRSEARRHLLREEASESYGRLGARQALQDKFLSVIQERLAALLAELGALWKHAQAGEVVAAATGSADAAADAAVAAPNPMFLIPETFVVAPKRRSISGTNKIQGRIDTVPISASPKRNPVAAEAAAELSAGSSRGLRATPERGALLRQACWKHELPRDEVVADMQLEDVKTEDVPPDQQRLIFEREQPDVEQECKGPAYVEKLYDAPFPVQGGKEMFHEEMHHDAPLRVHVHQFGGTRHPARQAAPHL